MGQGTKSWHSLLFGILVVIEVVTKLYVVELWTHGFNEALLCMMQPCHCAQEDGFVVSEKVKF